MDVNPRFRPLDAISKAYCYFFPTTEGEAVSFLGDLAREKDGVYLPSALGKEGQIFLTKHGGYLQFSDMTHLVFDTQKRIYPQPLRSYITGKKDKRDDCEKLLHFLGYWPREAHAFLDNQEKFLAPAFQAIESKTREGEIDFFQDFTNALLYYHLKDSKDDKGEERIFVSWKTQIIMPDGSISLPSLSLKKEHNLGFSVEDHSSFQPSLQENVNLSLHQILSSNMFKYPLLLGQTLRDGRVSAIMANLPKFCFSPRLTAHDKMALEKSSFLKTVRFILP